VRYVTQLSACTAGGLCVQWRHKPTERKDYIMTITEFIEDLEKARAKYGDLKLFVARGYQLYPVESLDLFDCRVGYNEHYDEFFESNNAGFGAEEAVVLG
jgi:hypothetical protein